MAFLMALLCSVSKAASYSSAQEHKMFHRGLMVAKSLCDTSLLQQIKPDSSDVLIGQKVDILCHNLGNQQRHSLLFFLHHFDMNLEYKGKLIAPHKSKCPVCGMYPYKDPSWVAMMSVKKRDFYFDGVKDLMKFYLLDKKYRYNRKEISKIAVQDYYSLKVIDAKKAYYVVGSDVRGPMGEELIPFQNRSDAMIFLKDHTAKRILTFDEITLSDTSAYAPYGLR
jgi:nitrous oxide reductase accessory protein NosL